jgi:hypothetical protein
MPTAPPQTPAEVHLEEMRELAERIASLVSGTSYHIPVEDLAELGVELAELVRHYEPAEGTAPPATRYTDDEKAAFGVTDEDLKR